jgi:hypothetical protein
MNGSNKAWGGLIAGAIAFADGAAYLIIIERQGESGGRVVPLVFAAISIGGIAGVGGSIVSPGRGASLLLVSSAVILGVLGVLGIFSVGLPLLLAAGFSMLGLAQSRGGKVPVGRGGRAALAALVAAGLLVAVFFLVQISGGGKTVGVSCRGSAPGVGMPSVPGRSTRHIALRPHACRTISSP